MAIPEPIMSAGSNRRSRLDDTSAAKMAPQPSAISPFCNAVSIPGPCTAFMISHFERFTNG